MQTISPLNLSDQFVSFNRKQTSYGNLTARMLNITYLLLIVGLLSCEGGGGVRLDRLPRLDLDIMFITLVDLNMGGKIITKEY